MSDYVRNKSVMYPIDCEALGIEDGYDLEERIPDALKDHWDGEYPYFDIDALLDYETDKLSYYLSFRLDSEYGKTREDFGRNRPLTPTEQVKYKKIFEQVLPDIDASKLKYVDCCYYNCSECQDYYITHDDFNNEI